MREEGKKRGSLFCNEYNVILKGVQLIFMHYLSNQMGPTQSFSACKILWGENVSFSLSRCVVVVADVSVHFLEPFIPVEVTQENWCCREKNSISLILNGNIAFVQHSNEYEIFIIIYFLKNVCNLWNAQRDALEQQREWCKMKKRRRKKMPMTTMLKIRFYANEKSSWHDFFLIFYVHVRRRKKNKVEHFEWQTDLVV